MKTVSLLVEELTNLSPRIKVKNQMSAQNNGRIPYLSSLGNNVHAFPSTVLT
ncbi:hypothetical protein J6590_037652 [Homalodisca vitripennis]|nr:hypothetical protein J6590_037652 [Homalodisca vitripennis]